jgi:UDP-GlcNAc:undecaprenyl-phosphate/decaprenyl-phosphate GlcNAc-1-phosphate transferase
LVVDYLIVFAVAMATVAAVTPVVRWVSLRFGVGVDQPEARKMHRRPTSRLGGLGLFAAMITGIGVASLLTTFDDVFAETSEPEAIILAAVVIVGLGLFDDTRGISAPAKLAGQILAAGILVLFGFRLLFVYIPPGTVISLSPDLGALITIVAIVAMINAVNLVDGLDGLAAGIAGIAAAALFWYVTQAEPLAQVGLASSASLMLAICVGAAVGFLFFNFNPASIFMGDTGAMLLGLLLAAAGISAIQGTVQPARGTFAALSVPVLVPALVLAVPLFDTIWAILRRLRSGGAVFSPDKKHLHHRLVEIGHSHRRAVLIMYYWSALVAFAAVGVGLLPLPVVGAVVAVGVAFAVLFAGVNRLLDRRRRGGREDDYFVFSFTKSRRVDSESAPDQHKHRHGEL